MTKFLLHVKWKLSWERIAHHCIDWPPIFLNEILISAIKFLERLLKPQGFIALWQKLINQAFVAISEIIIVWAASCISYELWNVHTIRRARWKGMENLQCGSQNHHVCHIAWLKAYLHYLWWMWDQGSLPGDMIC